MALTDNEKRDIIKLIEENKPLPEEYRFKLFEKSDEIELIWNGKSYDITNVSLPFQIIEHIDEPREEKKIEAQANLFDKEGRQLKGWTNKLIWGNNSLILSSLINGPLRKEIEDEGGLKLVYIDPPFDVSDDFKFDIDVGNQRLSKKRTGLEQLAFSDTWGEGPDSFLSMMYERLKLLRELLSEDGSILVHCDSRQNSNIRLILDEIFGINNLRNEIIWKRTSSHNDANRFGRINDTIYYYSKSDEYYFQPDFIKRTDEQTKKEYPLIEEGSGRRYASNDLSAAGSGPPRTFNGKLMSPPKGTHWRWSQERIDEGIKNKKIFFSKNGVPRYKRYADEIEGKRVQNIWDDFMAISSQSKELLGYPTQKPKKLLQRIIKCCSKENDIVMDCFCGSGTTLEVAEILNRKWIGCDLGKFAIHTSRKRLIKIQREKKNSDQSYRAFEILNLGKYQREFFLKDYLYNQRSIKNEKSEEHYYEIILKAYKAKEINNLRTLKGVKNNRFIAIGPFNLHVTRLFVEKIIEECIEKKITKADVLGFEFESGLFPSIRDYASKKGIDLNCFYIPNEVFDKNAVNKNQVIFYATSFIDAEIIRKKNEFIVRLNGYSIFDSDTLFEETLAHLKNGEKREILMSNSIIKVQKDNKGKISKQIIKMKWEDWIDYWSVDFDFQSKQEIIRKENKKEEWTGDYIFENEWQDFRTNKKDKLILETPSRPIITGKKIAVKVVDIFGNDTMKILEI